jgi:viroplasmin and RNaseH domain-containing protein
MINTFLKTHVHSQHRVKLDVCEFLKRSLKRLRNHSMESKVWWKKSNCITNVWTTSLKKMAEKGAHLSNFENGSREPVVHTCNPGYSGEDQEDWVPGQLGQKVSETPISQPLSGHYGQSLSSQMIRLQSGPVQAKKSRPCFKNNQSKKDYRCGSSSRAPA